MYSMEKSVMYGKKKFKKGLTKQPLYDIIISRRGAPLVKSKRRAEPSAFPEAEKAICLLTYPPTTSPVKRAFLLWTARSRPLNFDCAP